MCINKLFFLEICVLVYCFKAVCEHGELIKVDKMHDSLLIWQLTCDAR